MKITNGNDFLNLLMKITNKNNKYKTHHIKINAEDMLMLVLKYIFLSYFSVLGVYSLCCNVFIKRLCNVVIFYKHHLEILETTH